MFQEWNLKCISRMANLHEKQMSPSGRPEHDPLLADSHLFGAPPLIALGVLLSALALSLGDLIEAMPPLALLADSSFFHLFHAIHDLLALAIALYAAYKYHTRLGITAILLFLAAHIPYGVIQYTKEAPELLRILVISFATIFGIGLIDRLRKTEGLYRTLATSSPVGIYIIQNGKFLFVNKQFAKDVGYTEDELLGSDPLLLVHVEDREMVRQNAIASLKGESTVPYEFRVINKAGETMSIMERVASIHYRGRRAALGHFINITQHKQAEEALTESEEKYRSLVENASDYIFMIGRDYKILSVNTSAASALRRRPDEILGKTIFDIFPERLASEYAKSLKAVFETGAASVRESQFTTGETESYISTSLSPVCSNANEVLAVIGMSRDITKSKRTEKALQESEKLYRSLFENMLNGFAYCKMFFEEDMPRDFVYLSVNSAFETLTGLKNVVGKKVSEVIPGIQKSDPELFEIYGRVALTGIPEKFETYVQSLEMWFSISVYSPEREYFVAVFDVITERKKTEKALVESEKKFRELANLLPQTICQIDTTGKVTFVNANAVDMFGYSIADLETGVNVWQMIVPENPDEAMGNFQRILMGEQVNGTEFKARRKDGSTFPILAYSRPFIDQDNPKEVKGSNMIVVDITERKKMDEQLMLNDRLASIGQLVSGVAHELNNPLTGVIGFSELLLEKEVPDDVHEDLITINREAKRTAGIVKGLLTFVRKQAIEKETVDINCIIQEVLQLRSYEQRVSNIEVITRFATDSPQIMGNSTQLQQVFINLIVNAEQAMLEAHGRGALTVSTERVGNIVKTCFSDDGAGIKPENMRRLFTPFFTTKEVGKGTGLGLSICHGIVTEHGGRIYAESEPGKGATFIVELPTNK